MALVFDDRDKRQLQTWIGGRKNFHLLYKASVDGCNSATFHTKCNNKGPTVSVFYNNQGTVYGGYNPNSWSNAGYVNVPNAFIFRLRQNGQTKPVQMKPKAWTGSEYSIYDNASYGPSFGYHGSGHEFLPFSGSISWNGTYFQMNGTIAFNGNVFDLKGENYNSIANGTNQVTDIEVYQLEGIFLLIL